jgi:preprotein translocase subunit SecE
MADKIKLSAAILILMGAIGAFYYFADDSLLLRVVGLLAAAGIAAAVAKQTVLGDSVWNFGRGSLIEIRKVVWPSRRETVQTTLIVMAMVVVVGLILWMFDIFLVWAIKFITGQGS